MNTELTPRERKVWIHVAHGRKQSAIAEDMGVCRNTVVNLRRSVVRKLGLSGLGCNEALAALVRAAASDSFFPA